MSELTRNMKKQCRFCGKEFITRKRSHIYCSDGCRYQHYQDTHIQISMEQWAEYQKLKEMINVNYIDRNDNYIDRRSWG